MAELVVFEHEDGALVVDSRIIAERLDIQHESFMKTINKYKKEAEQAFGHIRFEIGTVTNSVGAVNEVNFALLNEEQATFYMTLSRNTPEVVQLKLELVQKFSLAKKLLRQRGIYQQPHTTVYIRRLENMGDHEIADDLWAIFREAAEILLLVEKQFRVPVEQMDLCDGSIGTHWKNYRIGKPWAGAMREYLHRFRDKRPPVRPNAYTYSELPHFKKWLREHYITKHLPEYLIGKYGKRAVRQIYEERGKLDEYILELTEEKRISPKQEELYEIFLAAREAIANRYLPGE